MLRKAKVTLLFDDVKAVLFVIALCGYDITLIEDDTTNQIKKSL